MASNFLKSLDAGNKAEGMVQALLAEHDIDSVSGGKNAAFDLQHTQPMSFTSEVKFDIYAARSGNIAIEFYNPKSAKPSGIGITQANLWFHIITKPLSIWVTSVPKLKKYITDNPPHKTVACGGDDNASLYLYRMDKIFADIFHRVDNNEHLMSVLLDLLTQSGVS